MNLDGKKNILNSNFIKICACFFMLVDHIGAFLFPSVAILRVLGRIAFPIFAFFISQGCKYSKNKIKRIVSIGGLAILCELIFNFGLNMLEGNILLTFTFSILLIYLYKYMIKTMKNKNDNIFTKILFVVLFFTFLIEVYLLSSFIGVDYGFFGVITPLFVTVFDKDTYIESSNHSFINHLFKILGLFIGMTLVILNSSFIQFFSYLSILLLLFYNNKKGKYNIKYLFYVFYPLHLLIIYFITLI